MLVEIADAVGLAKMGIVCTISRETVNANPQALACKAGKPVYVLASTWKYTARRPPEVLSGESEGVFEFVPLAVVSRLITESPGGRRS